MTDNIENNQIESELPNDSDHFATVFPLKLTNKDSILLADSFLASLEKPEPYDLEKEKQEFLKSKACKDLISQWTGIWDNERTEK